MNDSIQQAAPPSTASTPSSQGATAAMWCHLSAIAGIVPFCNIIAPLVVWLSTKDKYPEVDANGKEAVNFQITMSGVFMAIYILSMVLSLAVIAFPRNAAPTASIVIAGFEIVSYIALAIFWFTVVIIAGMRASQGQLYRYPLSIRLIR